MNVADPVRGVALTLHVPLGDRANPGQFKANPTLAAGDVKVSKDGGAFANLATLPDVHPAAGTMVRVQLSSSEMDADEVLVVFRDAAGEEWTDLAFAIATRAHTLDETYAEAADAAAASAPTAAAVADAVWDEALAGHATAGSAGAALSAAGGAADPLTNPVPGSYASGTAGAALGRIGSAELTVVSPVADGGAVLTIYRGADYLAADGAALDFIRDPDAAEWPNLTGATIALAIEGGNTHAGSVVTPTGSGQKVRVALTRTQTAAILAGTFDYQIRAALATSGNVIPLVRGRLVVRETAP